MSINQKSDKLKKERFLEAGTNEMELLVFRLGDTDYGINIAKVREIIARTDTIKMPFSPDSVEGSFKLRDRILTLIDVGKHFKIPSPIIQEGGGIIVVVDFNHVQCGILVDSVERIFRLRWDEIESPSDYLLQYEVPITGVALIKQRSVLVIDFEKVLERILGVPTIPDLGDITEVEIETNKSIRMLCVDDSASFLHIIVDLLKRAGFKNIVTASNGLKAWEYLQDIKNDESKRIDLIMSDIEMPQMDGLVLTKKIKSDSFFDQIPIILFSSLVETSNLKNSQKIEADAQISKSTVAQVIPTIHRLMREKKDLSNG